MLKKSWGNAWRIIAIIQKPYLLLRYYSPCLLYVSVNLWLSSCRWRLSLYSALLIAHIRCWSIHFCLVSFEEAPFLAALILQPPPHFSPSLFFMSHVREQLRWKASIMAGCIVACVVSEGAGTPQCPPAQEAQTLRAWQLNTPFLPFQSPLLLCLAVRVNRLFVCIW